MLCKNQHMCEGAGYCQNTPQRFQGGEKTARIKEGKRERRREERGTWRRERDVGKVEGRGGRKEGGKGESFSAFKSDVHLQLLAIPFGSLLHTGHCCRDEVSSQTSPSPSHTPTLQKQKHKLCFLLLAPSSLHLILFPSIFQTQAMSREIHCSTKAVLIESTNSCLIHIATKNKPTKFGLKVQIE